MAWLVLAGAIGSEIAATLLLRSSDGLSRLWPSVGVVVGYVLSFVLLARVLRTIPVSVAYAVWSAAGTAVVATVGFTLLKEPVSALKIAGIVLVIVGVVLLNVGGAHQA